jgi:hypothetical protein
MKEWVSLVIDFYERVYKKETGKNMDPITKLVINPAGFLVEKIKKN